jgi:ADP-heptose:LPS heptosyltransferase
VARADHLGDLLMATPALAALRAARPAARLEVLASPWGAPALRGNPHVDAVRLFPATWYEAARAGSAGPAVWLEALVDLRGRPWDLGADLRGDPRVIALLALAGARRRVGHAGLGLEGLLDAAVEPLPALDHRRRNLEVVRLLGASARDAPDRPVYRVEEARVEEMSRRLAGLPRPLVVVAPGTNRRRHSWGAGGFAAAAEGLRAGAGAGLVLAGRQEDRWATAAVAARLDPPALDLTGETDLPGLAALLRCADLLLANDSGGVHLAVAVGCPVVALFGPTSPDLSFPYPAAAGRALAGPTGCRRPCFRRDCPESHGYEAITPAEVVRAGSELLEGRGAA